MMRRTALIILALCLYVGAGEAGAAVVPTPLPGPLDIDFRDVSFSGCNSTAGCTVGGVTVTPSPGLLFWASDDGFGVRGDDDESKFPKTLTVSFSPQILTGVWFTDIFTSADDDDHDSEEGLQAIVELSLGGGAVTVFNFFGEEMSPNNNGGKFGSFGAGFLADLVVFKSAGEFDDDLSDGYSVAGLTVVPLPGALGLMISGLAAFVIMARRRRKAVGPWPRPAGPGRNTGRGGLIVDILPTRTHA